MLWRSFRNCFFALLFKSIDLRHLNKRMTLMLESIVEIMRPMLPKHEKTTLLPLRWCAFRNCFFAIWLKRIYLRHLTKRIMRASIVEIVRPMIPKHEKNNDLAADMSTDVPSETVFLAILPKRIYLRHLNKRITRASIVEIVRPMLRKHEKITVLLLLWRDFRMCFLPFCPRAFTYDT